MDPTRNDKNVNKALKGKTIKRVDCNSLNLWVLHFTDGSSATIESLALLNVGEGTIHGPMLTKFTQT